MNAKDLKMAGLLVMLAILITTSPQWLNPANQKGAGYDAPWVYPSQQPAEK